MNNNLLVQQVQGQPPQFEVFNYKNLGSVRTTVDDCGNPWFCLLDVCSILNLNNPSKVVQRLDPKGLTSIQVLTNGGPQNTTFVDQGNLYAAIGRSRKPEAQNFMNWVYREVLPSIANKGYYVMNNVSPATAIMKIGEVLLDHENRLAVVEGYGPTIEQHGARITHPEHVQETLMNEGYFTISQFARYQNLPMTLEIAQNLGSTATRICQERGLATANIPHPELVYVNGFPYAILQEVFRNYYGGGTLQ